RGGAGLALALQVPRPLQVFAPNREIEAYANFNTDPGGASWHHPRTTNPVLILTNQIGRGLCLAHALRGFQRCMSPDMASLEPAIRKVLHRIENLVLNVPETTHIVLKRGGIGNHHALYGFQLSCRIIHPVFLLTLQGQESSAIETVFADRPRAYATLTG